MFIRNIHSDLILFIMLYGGAAMASLIACLYLLLRKGNAFADGITSPLRLRYWAAAFFAISFFGHIWWLLFYIYSDDINSVGSMVLSALDCVGLLTTIPGTLLAMLQDRKRSVWPIVTATIPYVVMLILNIVYHSGHFETIAIMYVMLLYVTFSIYMLFAVKQYGRWLRDNYADLEHKEVLLSQVLVIVILLLIVTYSFDGGNITISYFVQSAEIALFVFLLWRIETLPQLDNMPAEQQEQVEQPTQQPLAILSNIEQLLDKLCVATQLYLQHNLTLLQLAQTIGTNRFYLSQYFSRQGITYNAYINNLRINHFVKLYRDTTAAQKPISAHQMAHDSGYRSYSTFSLAFKQRMGKSVTAWMHDTTQ